METQIERTTVAGIEIKDLIKQKNIIDKINNNNVFYSCYSSDPIKTIKNFCQYLFNEMEKKATDNEVVNSFTKSFDPYFLYGLPQEYNGIKEQTWEEVIISQLKLSKKHLSGRKGIQTLFFVRDMEKNIPVKELYIPMLKSCIKYIELAYVAKEITKKIKASPTSYCILSRNYFLCEKSKESYFKKTKRNITPHKLALIFRLLNDYDYILKKNLSTSGAYKPNSFSIGNKNYYKDKI